MNKKEIKKAADELVEGHLFTDLKKPNNIPLEIEHPMVLIASISNMLDTYKAILKELKSRI